MNDALKVLAIAVVMALLASCVHVRPVSDSNRTSLMGQENDGEPFSEFSVCPAQWTNLLSEWSQTKSAEGRTVEEIFALTVQERDGSIVGGALRIAWAVRAAPVTAGQFPTEAQELFIEKISPHLREDCRSITWMAVAVSDLPTGHWLMKVHRGPEGFLEHGDSEGAMDFIRLLIDFPRISH